MGCAWCGVWRTCVPCRAVAIHPSLCGSSLIPIFMAVCSPSRSTQVASVWIACPGCRRNIDGGRLRAATGPAETTRNWEAQVLEGERQRIYGSWGEQTGDSQHSGWQQCARRACIRWLRRLMCVCRQVHAVVVMCSGSEPVLPVAALTDWFVSLKLQQQALLTADNLRPILSFAVVHSVASSCRSMLLTRRCSLHTATAYAGYRSSVRAAVRDDSWVSWPIRFVNKMCLPFNVVFTHMVAVVSLIFMTALFSQHMRTCDATTRPFLSTRKCLQPVLSSEVAFLASERASGAAFVVQAYCWFACAGGSSSTRNPRHRLAVNHSRAEPLPSPGSILSALSGRSSCKNVGDPGADVFPPTQELGAACGHAQEAQAGRGGFQVENCKYPPIRRRRERMPPVRAVISWLETANHSTGPRKSEFPITGLHAQLGDGTPACCGG